MNFARPMTPATTGPLSMPIRTSKVQPGLRGHLRELGPHRKRHVSDRLRVVRPGRGMPPTTM